MKSLLNFWSRYRVVRRRVDDSTSWKSILLSMLIGLLLTAVWATPIFIMIGSLFVFVDLIIPLTILIFVVVTGLIYAYSFTYYAVLKKFEPSIESMNTHLIVIIESTLIGLIIIIIGIIFVIQLFGRI
jgi:hypothetical protein